MTFCIESRCFGFIEFKQGVDIDELLRDLPHIIDGKEVECKLAVPKDPPKDDKKRKKKKKKTNEVNDSPSKEEIDNSSQIFDSSKFH